MNEPIWVRYGRDARAMAMDLLAAAQVAGRIPAGASVAIKPNLVVPGPASLGAVTHPELVEGVLRYLIDCGITDITIMEGSWVGASTRQAFRDCGFDELARRYDVRLLDLKGDETVQVTVDGETLSICRSALEAGYLINMPVIKGHCQTRMTCALKNMKGCIPDREKRRFHALGLQRPIALLAAALRPSVTLADGLCGDLEFEEGGNPVAMDRAALCFDPVRLDAWVCALLGFSLGDVPYISMAAALGAGSAHFEPADIVLLNEPPSLPQASPSRRIEKLARHIDARQACSACYGSLLHALSRMQDAGTLARVTGRIRIGQGYRDQQPRGTGIGRCAAGCARWLPGCPPTARAIREFLEDAFRG
jgi:uncharacterized protein (DUF362 family)